MIDAANIQEIMGATVLDTQENKVGTVGQVYVDPDSGKPNWITVKTGLFGTSESFVPLDEANLSGDGVHVPYGKDQVKDAPRIDTDGALSPADEDELYRHYGMSDSGTTGTDTMDSGTTGFAGVGRDDDRSGADTDGRDRDAVGHDTSGPTTDSAMTRSEEQLHVGTEDVQTGRARLRKYVTTENETVTVPVQREEVRLEREPITDANRGDATSGPDITEEEHEVVLNEERVVVDKETVPVERVRLDKETVTEQQQVSEEVRKEQIEFDGDDANRTDGNDRTI